MSDEFDMLSNLLTAARATLQAEEDEETSAAHAIGAFRVTAGGGQSPEYLDDKYVDDGGGMRTPAARGTPRSGGGGQRSGLNATAAPFLTRQQTPPHAAQSVMFSSPGDNFSAHLATWPPPNHNSSHLQAAPMTSGASGPGGRSTYSHAFHPSMPPFHNHPQPGAPAAATSTAATSSHTFSAAQDAIPLEWVQQFAQQHPHLIAVLNLEPRTSKKQLWDIFYPMGAVEAAVMGSNNPSSSPGATGISGTTSKRGVGVVMFSSADMAKIAAEKMNDFVPHGQSFPLVVSYVAPITLRGRGGVALPQQAQQPRDRYSRPLPATGTGGGHSSQSPSLPSSVNTSAESGNSTYSGQGSSSSSSAAAVAPSLQDLPEVTPETSNASLLAIFVSLLGRIGIGSDDLATIFLRILCRPQSTKTLVEDVVRAVRDHIEQLGPTSAAFVAPLSRALQYVSAFMEPELTRGFDASLPAPPASLVIAAAGARSQHAQQMFSSFKLFISQLMLQILFNATAEKTCRSFAAVMIGYLFDLEFLAGGTPFSMAEKLLTTNRAAIAAAHDYYAVSPQDHASDEDTDAAQQHASSYALVDALVSMISNWSSRHSQRTPDASEESVRALLRAYTLTRERGGAASNDASRTSMPSRTASTPREHDASGQPHRRTPPPTPTSSHSAIGYSPSKVRPGTTSPSSEIGAGDTSFESVGSGTGGGYSATAPGIWQAPQRLVAPPPAPLQLHVSQPSVASSGAAFTFETTLQKDLLACTVYLTKLPGGLTDAKIRRLITYFGEFNKVRMYKEKTPPALRGGAGASSQQNRGCFGFVEYAQPSSAKAVIDYFRNASMTSNTAFHFLIGGDLTTAFTIDEIGPLSLTRASYAKSAIHDQHPKDAIFEPIAGDVNNSTGSNAQPPNIKVQVCMFGLVGDGAGGQHAALLQHQMQQQHLQQQPPLASFAAGTQPHGFSTLPARAQGSSTLLGTPQRGGRALETAHHQDPVVSGQHYNPNTSAATTSSTNSNDQLGAFKLGLFDASDTTW